ncbi:MAG: DUF3310 domain-containing protein [Ruminococcus flavefaciens]|nr:DUF3310 domain-containing protein [Ruminococcus flavefaciens]
MNNVNHPSHYNQGKYECIDVMLDVFSADAVKDFCICNVFKYIWRYRDKNGAEDMEKALFYLKKWVELNGGNVGDTD